MSRPSWVGLTESWPACQDVGTVEQRAVVSGDLVRLRQFDQVLATA